MNNDVMLVDPSQIHKLNGFGPFSDSAFQLTASQMLEKVNAAVRAYREENDLRISEMPELQYLGLRQYEFVGEKPAPDDNAVYYVASPYTHPDPLIMLYRYYEAIALARWLTTQGYIFITPIVSTHPIGDALGDNLWSSWARVDKGLINVSSGVILGMFHGWKKSIGVSQESIISIEAGKPIFSVRVLS